MFEVRGTHDGEPIAVQWDAGKLTGDEFVIADLQLQATLSEGHDIGPACGPFTRTRHLESPLSTYILLLRVLDEVDDMTGDAPQVPVTPGVVH